MSGKARLGASRATAPIVRPEELDDNISTYQIEADGRSAEERMQHVRLDHIESSPFQIRRVFPETEVEELADSIRDNGLVHPPKGRPHASKPGWVELMPGEMRLRALQRLIERGEADALLKRDRERNWLVPIVVVQVDDDRAESIVFAENEARTDLSPWEWTLAWQQRRDRRAERGQPATVRDVAAAHRKPHTTVGEYLKVADSINAEVLSLAGVMSGDAVDHGRMARLSFSALKGVTKSAADSPRAAAEHLLQELRKVGDRPARELLQRRRSAARPADRHAKGSFQINIRQPLPELTPRQATHYLGRISVALPVLARKAVDGIGQGEAQELVSLLRETLDLLQSRG